MKRFLKFVAVFAIFGTALSYFAFRIMFFDPFEDEFGSLHGLVPRDAHVFIQRENLDQDIYDFPALEFFESLRLTKEWKDFQETSYYAEAEEKWQLAELFADLRQQVEQMQPLDVMDDLLGREIVALGRFRDDGTVSGAVMCRASFRVKAMVAGLQYGFVRGFAGDNIESYSEEAGVSTVRIPSGEEIHIFRLQDVVVAGNDLQLVRDMRALVDDEGNKMSSSPHFSAAINETSDTGRPLDFAFDIGHFAEKNDLLRFKADEFDPVHWKWFAQTVAPEDFDLAVGRLFLGSEIELNLRAGADMSKLGPRSGGLYTGSSDDLTRMYQFCGKVFPQSAFACGYLKVEMRSFLRRMESCIQTDQRDLMTAFIKEIKKRNPDVTAATVAEWLEMFADCFGNELIFAMEQQSPYKIPKEEEIRFPQESWGPRVAMLFPLARKSMAQALVDAGIRAAQSMNVGVKVFNWSFSGTPYAFREIELPDEMYPSLSVGFIDFDEKDYLVVTTTGQFAEEIYGARLGTDPLGDALHYRQAEASIRGFGQGFVYVQSEGLKKSLVDLAKFFAEENTRPNDIEVRKGVEQQIRDKYYPSERGKPVTDEQRRQIEVEVDDEMDRLDLRWKTETVPREVEARKRDLQILHLFRWATMTYTVNERDLQIRVHMATPARFPVE